MVAGGRGGLQEPQGSVEVHIVGRPDFGNYTFFNRAVQAKT